MNITREEAIDALYEVINSGIIKEELSDELQEIANCIRDENLGMHTWGAGAEIGMLYVSTRQDLITDEMDKKAKEIYEKHAFTPAPYEEDYFNENE